MKTTLYILLGLYIFGIIRFWFGLIELSVKMKNYEVCSQKSLKKENTLTAYTIICIIKLVVMSLIPILNFILGMIYSSKKLFNDVIPEVFEDE